MAKAKKEKVSTSNCAICKGNTTIVDFTLPEFTGKRCDECMKIFEYVKT